MKMYKFQIAVDYHHGDDKSDAESFDCEYDDPGYAAQMYVKYNYCDLEYPEEAEVTVWGCEGEKTHWVVTAEPSVDFSSTRTYI